jgi:hypothetical protein
MHLSCEAEDAPAWEATDVSACRCILGLPRLDVPCDKSDRFCPGRKYAFPPHPIVEIAAIDHLPPRLGITRDLRRRIQVNAVRRTMTLQFGMP